MVLFISWEMVEIHVTLWKFPYSTVYVPDIINILSGERGKMAEE